VEKLDSKDLAELEFNSKKYLVFIPTSLLLQSSPKNHKHFKLLFQK